MAVNFDTATVNKLLGITEQYRAPDKLMSILLDSGKRQQLFDSFLKLETDLSYDWFREYFQQQQADRGNKKQDFTPVSVSKLLAMLTGKTESTLDFATGTGGLTIQKWWTDKQDGKDHSYWLEEITEAAIPFLLFNCLIRQMNAVVINGDTLERTANQVYLCNKGSLNIVLHTDENADIYDIKKWTSNEIEHQETDIEVNPLPIVKDGVKSETNIPDQEEDFEEQIDLF